MYHSFEASYEYFKEFFKKYSDRVLLGTDGTFPWLTKCHVWCIEVLYKYIATTEKTMAFDDKILTGIGLTGEAKENILYKNFERRVGEAPKEIDKSLLKAYIDKYKPLLSEDEWAHIEPLYNEYLV